MSVCIRNQGCEDVHESEYLAKLLLLLNSLATLGPGNHAVQAGLTLYQRTSGIGRPEGLFPGNAGERFIVVPRIVRLDLPATRPPKSSTAIWAASTEPGPVGVEAGPDRSVSTPILTTSSEICA